MTVEELRARYPVFEYQKFEYTVEDGVLVCTFTYSLPPDHSFTHVVTFENLTGLTLDKVPASMVFALGLAEATGYWKTTCSPTIEVKAGKLDDEQTLWWHRLYINGFAQYFYENKINYLEENFLRIISTGSVIDTNTAGLLQSDSVLLPVGGGKDSVVTGELLKPHFDLRPIVVLPASPAALRISGMLSPQPAVVVTRKFDGLMLRMNSEGYLNGHVPYSAIIGMMFVIAAAVEGHKYIAVSNERSSNEGNVMYLGQEVNHQYSKSEEFEKDLNEYLKKLHLPVVYFSFLRPLYELQIAKLFSRLPQYFDTFRSCNKGQKDDLWCGNCAKCVSISLTLGPWVGEEVITRIFGGMNPRLQKNNEQILKEMTDPDLVKPFECITTVEEAQVCVEFLENGITPRVQEFLDRWGESDMPDNFASIIKSAYWQE